MRRLLLLFFIFGLVSANWVSNSTLVSGLADVGTYSLPEAFMLGEEICLVSAELSIALNPYSWNATGWISNSSCSSGITAVSYGAFSVFEREGQTHAIRGNSDGTLVGYTWNGTVWASNSTIVSGISDVGASSAPTVWEMDGQYHILIGESVTILNPMTWNGTAWISNTTVDNGITAVTYSLPKVFYNPARTRYEAIIGDRDAVYIAYYVWNGTAWASNTTAMGNITTPSAGAFANIVQLDGKYALIHGNAAGTFVGYYLNESTGAVPILSSLSVSPSVIHTSDLVSCAVNYTDTDNATLIVELGVAINGTVNSTYTQTNTTYENSTLWTISTNISGHAVGTNISCYSNASDGSLTTTRNFTSNITITYRATPESQSISISPATIYLGYNTTCETNWTDNDSGVFSVQMGVAINGVLDGNTTNASFQNATNWSYEFDTDAQPIGTNISCWANATDGETSSALIYSENKTVNNYPPPTLQSLNLSPTTLYYNEYAECTTNWTDTDTPILTVALILLVNGAVVENDTNNSFSSGEEWMKNYSTVGYAHYDNVSCGTYANDSTTNVSITYTSNKSIQPHPYPVLVSDSIEPYPFAVPNETINCTYRYADEDNATFTVNRGLLINGAVNSSYTILNTSYGNDTSWVEYYNTTGYGEGTTFQCWANATDGETSTENEYTNTVTISYGYSMDLSAYTCVSSGVPTCGTIGMHIYAPAEANISSILLRIGNEYAGEIFEYNAYYEDQFELPSSGTICDDVGCDWVSTDNWTWVRFDLRTPISNVSSVVWTGISMLEIEFTKESATGNIYVDYMSISNSTTMPYQYNGTRQTNRTIWVE